MNRVTFAAREGWHFALRSEQVNLSRFLYTAIPACALECEGLGAAEFVVLDQRMSLHSDSSGVLPPVDERLVMPETRHEVIDRVGLAPGTA